MRTYNDINDILPFHISPFASLAPRTDIVNRPISLMSLISIIQIKEATI